MYQIVSGGIRTYHPAPFAMNSPAGVSEYVLLNTHSKAEFEIGNRHFTISPERLVIIPPNCPYRYTALEESYTDDWMHFTCSNTDTLPNHPALTKTELNPVNNTGISLYFKQALWEYNYGPKSSKGLHVHFLLTMIFNHLLDPDNSVQTSVKYSPYKAKFQDLRLHIESNPGISLELTQICEEFSMSPSYFQHLYSDFFGVSFRNDVIQMRISYAQNLLLRTNYTVEHIALLSGYHNEVHFYRQFKKVAGMTPTEFRSRTTS